VFQSLSNRITPLWEADMNDHSKQVFLIPQRFWLNRRISTNHYRTISGLCFSGQSQDHDHKFKESSHAKVTAKEIYRFHMPHQ
jgi:hypothetical protein